MLKKLKSLFVIEEESSSVETTEDKSPMAKTKIESQFQSTPIHTTSSSTRPTSDSTLGNNVQTDEKFIDVLLKAVDAHNVEGFDYLEYKNSLKSLEPIIADEKTRYMSAFEMGKTMGLTKQILTTTGQKYLNVLSNEMNKFNEAVKNQKNLQIHNKEEEMKSLSDKMNNIDQTIQKLLKEKEELSNTIQKIRTEMDEAVQKIDITNAQFSVAYNLIRFQISDDISKINEYL